jgi:hypothetical protein
MVVSAFEHRFPLSHDLGTLAGGLGCFPLDREAYPPRTDSPGTRNGLRSLPEVGNLVGPLIQAVLYGHYAINRRLYLNIFRREPDISELD